MSKYEFKLNTQGVRELLKSGAVQSMCSEYASQTLNACGDGYESKTQIGKNRASAVIYPATPHAHYSNLKHNTLLKALGSSGGK